MGRTTCTAAGAPPGQAAMAGPSRLAEYNQHTQVRILQRALRLEVAPPIEVFSNNPKLRNLAEF